MQEVDLDPDLMATHPLVAGLDHEFRIGLLERFRAIEVEQGDKLITFGAPDRVLFLILDGEAAVFVRHDGARYKVATLATGALVGEMSFFDVDSLRGADVVATKKGTVAAIAYADYMALAHDGDPAAEALEKAMLDTLGDRMRETNERIAALLDKHQSGGLLGALSRLFGV